ncbi:hypothetical protein KOW79_008617 [Hemibagrus wyckioides]|uniref:Saposin B-type domain-containing protein n=1 Tax=Hemibagrus wyckioides TaxID=337641 RepID=A0A9D3NTD4_9TELE|nr:hypothetical protein KOW79_008617 [Hemibagrus wyckioides]
MSPLILLGFLLFCSVVADTWAVPHEPSLKNKTEEKLLMRSDGSPLKDDDKNKKGMRCLVCRHFMRKTMPSVSRNLRKKLEAACHNFADFHLKYCMKKALELHRKVMEFIFPKKNPKLANMSSVILLGFLLTISVVFAEHGGFSNSSHIMTDQHDGILNIAAFTAPPKWQKNPIVCCTCQDFVKITKPKTDLKMQLKINKFCNMFTQRVKIKCLQIGAKLKRKIVEKIFPGKIPRDTCRKFKLCMY